MACNPTAQSVPYLSSRLPVVPASDFPTHAKIPAMRIPLVSILFAFASPTIATAQGFIESISPPVLEVGKTTRVTFVGKEFAPGLDVWSSLPEGHLTAKYVEGNTDRLVFDVT